jgi:hypothetical protein
MSGGKKLTTPRCIWNAEWRGRTERKMIDPNEFAMTMRHTLCTEAYCP